MWWAIAIAFMAGVLLFALIWVRGRGQPDFYRPGEAEPTSASTDYTPLPVPAGDGSGQTGDMGPGNAPAPGEEAAIIERDAAQIVETPASQAPPPLPMEPPASNGPASQPVPLAGNTPSPTYPAHSLRRGERGKVLVQATIGVNGVPESVAILHSSGSRDLDRAAMDAVRRWRFQPATQGGRPTTGVVNIPIDFNPGR